MCYGYTFSKIRNEVTMSELATLYNYQLEHPAIHQLVAGYLGFYDDKNKNKNLAVSPEVQMKNHKSSLSNLRNKNKKEEE